MKLGPRPQDSDSSANRSSRSGCCGSVTVISRITRSKMGQTLMVGDPAMTLAAVDRLVHHATIFETGNTSWRFKNRS